MMRSHNNRYTLTGVFVPLLSMRSILYHQIPLESIPSCLETIYCGFAVKGS
jgi:hypothetical protein